MLKFTSDSKSLLEFFVCLVKVCACSQPIGPSHPSEIALIQISTSIHLSLRILLLSVTHSSMKGPLAKPGRALRIKPDGKRPYPQTPAESSGSPSRAQNQENDPVKNYTLDPSSTLISFYPSKEVVRIKSLLDVVGITVAHVLVNTAQLELVLLVYFNEKYAK
nr:hypothetical protein [Tanacetum cinerariifolium]